VKQLSVILAAILLMAFLTNGVWAANVGKISGKIIDVATNEPIPSVNITLVGTTAGASTNADGEFFILNVDVGTYSVRVTSLGYETQNITGVQVLADQTFMLNIKLKETVLQGEEVTVVAERDVIKRDVSTTIRSVTSQEITALPIITYRDALARSAGVVGSNNNLHFRGGRADEVLYLVDGMQVKDPQFATRALDVNPGAIGEMQVLTAGFNAEFGEAQSAVVNLVLREGDPQYHGRISHQMDFQGSANIAVERPHYQDYDNTEASLSGPEPITSKLLPKLGLQIPGSMSFFASGTAWGRNTNDNGVWINTDRWYRHQMTNIFGLDARKNQAYTNSTLKLTYAPTSKDKISLNWNQAESWVNPYSFRLSRRFPEDYTTAEQSLGTHALAAIQGYASNASDYPNIYGKDDDHDGRVDEEALNWQDDDGDGLIDEDLQPYHYNANDHARTDVVRDQQFGVTFNHDVNKSTFYTMRLSGYTADRTRTGENKAPALYGAAAEPFVDLPDAQGRYNKHYDIGEPFTDLNGNGMYDFNNPDNAYPAVNGFVIAGDGLAGVTGQLVPSWANYTSRTFMFKTDVTSQINPRHMVKTGVELNYYNTASNDRPYPQITNDGNGIYTDIYRYYPVSGAIYGQDKMEYKDIIVNAGLRVDYWKIGGNRILDPVFQQTHNNQYVDYQPPKKNGEIYVSPRLGIAYSVTANDVFHFNYGYFYERGRQDYYFTAVNQVQTGGTPIIGNPSLKPMKTIAYELGVRHQFAGDFLLDMSTYYKDIKNWINTASQNQLYFELYNRLIQGTNAAIYYNADFASVRGVEFNLTKDYGSHLSGRLTYTLSWATGKNSYDVGSDVTRNNYIDPKRETSLAWDRRHQFVFNLGYNTPLEGKAFTEKWFKSGWSANLLSQALSGLPYTPSYQNGTDVFGQEFSKNSPWTYTTDVSIGRTFGSGPLKWQASLIIHNLFDRSNVLGWDNNPSTLDTYLNGQPGYVNDNASPNYGQNPKSGANPDAWDARRQIVFGLALEF
jgi:outer membrane receptor protein involved in Fe transport